jgi:hypothetical protein
MFSKLYRVTQKYFYAHPYTSMWAPVVARQISKPYSSSDHVFISIKHKHVFLYTSSPDTHTHTHTHIYIYIYICNSVGLMYYIADA